MKKKIIIILTLIVLLGGGLRFWRLASHPVSLSIDEIAIGYNSYSLCLALPILFGSYSVIAKTNTTDNR